MIHLIKTTTVCVDVPMCRCSCVSMYKNMCSSMYVEGREKPWVSVLALNVFRQCLVVHHCIQQASWPWRF